MRRPSLPRPGKSRTLGGMSEPASERVTLERDGHVLLMGINRPEKRNAFDLATIDALAAAYEELGRDPELRVGVLFGHGDHFSAGLDLAQVGPAVAQHGPQALGGGRTYDPFGVWGPPVPKPIVLAVCGIAYTLSIELALASDIVIAAEGTRFRQLEIGRGILPFGGATIRAPAMLGWGNAMRFLLTAEEFGAAEAHRIGLVQEVVPAGEHVTRAREIAQLVARQAPLGVQGTLANARVAAAQGAAAATEHLRGLLPGILASQDAAEGVASFVQRRDATFRGK
jgi:enoyl-CoA hydratase/carnithine racemase